MVTLSTTAQPTAWHSLEYETALTLLESSRQEGLSYAQVQERAAKFGPNELEEKPGRSIWHILLDQFTNIMLLMLIAVAVVSALLGEAKDAIAILVIVGLNGLLGYVQESRAELALAALKKLSAPIVRGIRQGSVQELPGQELVPGDVVLLEAGGQVPADGRLLEAVNMRVREAALTGEAQPVSKAAHVVLAADAPLGDRTNLVFQGTEVLQGRDLMVVTDTGMKSVAMATCQRASFANRQTVWLLNPKQIQSCMACFWLAPLATMLC